MRETIYKTDIPISIAHISDVHNMPPKSMIPSLRLHHPDIITITGDTVYGRIPDDGRSVLQEQTYVIPFLEECVRIAPTFLSLGNHEWVLDMEDLQVISSTGVTVLDNSYTIFSRTVYSNGSAENKNIVIGGLTSGKVLVSRKLGSVHEVTPEIIEKNGLDDPELHWLDDYFKIPGYHLLLNHHPEYWPQLHAPPIDLCLSGHAHGGQWRFYNPLKHRMCGVYAPGQGFFPTLTEGMHDGRLVISRGLSNTVKLVPRFFNEIELVYVLPSKNGIWK